MIYLLHDYIAQIFEKWLDQLTHFCPMVYFYTPWKHLKTVRFTDISKEYRCTTLATNGLTWCSHTFDTPSPALSRLGLTPPQ